MATSFTLSETIITEIMRRLNQDLKAYIDNVNASVTDGITIDYPASGMIFDFPPPMRLLTDFPALALVDGDTAFEDDTSWSATGIHDFTIVAFCQDLEQRNLAFKLRRYARAVASCILNGRTLPPDGWGVTVTRISPGPTLHAQTDPRTRMSWVTIGFRVRTDQTVG